MVLLTCAQYSNNVELLIFWIQFCKTDQLKSINFKNMKT